MISDIETLDAAVIGGGPAGLMAAETLADRGVRVVVFERMPSLARKLLMAGRGGLNITHNEDYTRFVARYGAALSHLKPALDAFTPADMRAWCEALGQPAFVGSSGRVFPQSMKASPLLRAWLRRLADKGVAVKLRHTFRGWDDAGCLVFENADGASVAVRAGVTVLALGGASWPRLGSDGGWTAALARHGVAIAPLRPANCGFEVGWSAHMREHLAGAPVKNVTLSACGHTARGEFTLSAYGIEGGVVYALSAPLRDAIEADGETLLHVDLRPDTPQDALQRKLAQPRGKASLSNHLRKRVNLSPAEIALLRETGAPFDDPAALSAHIKALPLRLLRPRPLERAISTAGGVPFAEIDSHFMLTRMPGVFCAGEMLDWEAPTGGYLLQGCFATGKAAGAGAADWL